MNQLSVNAAKTFNLVSIGQRGVGKTVFLVGSYIELHSGPQTNHSQQLWLDCEDSQEQEKIDKVINYIAQSGQYPPATMKMTDFNFSLKRRSLWGGTKTLCHFRWWDLPGELCNIRNPKFQEIVLTSHGCCVFINAKDLVNDRAYLQTLEVLMKQVEAIASLVHQHSLKYAFALIFTKCDLLESQPVTLLQIEEQVQPLLAQLNAWKANYQKFYSAIPLVSAAGVTNLKATGADAPLLWLVSELRRHNLQVGQDLGSGLKQGFTNSASKARAVKSLRGLGLPQLSRRTSSILLGTAGVSLLGVSAALLLGWSSFTMTPKQSQVTDKRIREYEQLLQNDPNNSNALIELTKLHVQMGQHKRAIPLMEKLVQLDPSGLDLRLNLAQLYKQTNQNKKAETVYDQILVQEKHNVVALINKAILRSKQGDNETARTLFVQAEKVAPRNLKPKIQSIAKNTLPSPTQ